MAWERATREARLPTEICVFLFCYYKSIDRANGLATKKTPVLHSVKKYANMLPNGVLRAGFVVILRQR